MTNHLGNRLRKWDQRVERAGELAGQFPFATEVLTFYAKLAAFQQGLYSRHQSTFGSKAAHSSNGRLSPELSPLEIKALMPHFRPFLAFLVKEGTSAMAGFASRLEKNEPDEWALLLDRFWRRNERDRKESDAIDDGAGEAVRSETGAESSDEGLRRFTALAFLQPYAEYLACRFDLPELAVRRPVCPICGSKPFVGVLRPEGEGAKRSLVCSFCYSEWDYLRIACPACEESRDDKMCVYTASKFELVRVEACETCKTYVMTVDLTKNGRAIPEVDELAAIPLIMWADGQGYTKISPNIFNS